MSDAEEAEGWAGQMVSRASLQNILGFSQPCCAASLERGEPSPVGLLRPPWLLPDVCFCTELILHVPPLAASPMALPSSSSVRGAEGPMADKPGFLPPKESRRERMSPVSGHSKGQAVH